MNPTSAPWVIKYAPKTIENMILTEELKQYFSNIIKKQDISNLCLTGNAGIGKTTLAKLITDLIHCANVKFQPCSIDGSIDMIKSTVNDFCQIMTDPGKIKVIILDEADQLSVQAQMALRNIIVDSLSDTRFILTCNYLDKIIPALQSRCTPVKLQFSLADVIKHIVKILYLEKIKIDKNNLTNFINNTIKKRYPDIRSIIENLQLACNSGTLIPLADVNTAIDNEILTYILEHKNNIKDVRQYLLNNEEKFSGDYALLAGKLFNAMTDNPEALLIIADYIYRMSFVLDKEIQFFAMLLQIFEH